MTSIHRQYRVPQFSNKVKMGYHSGVTTRTPIRKEERRYEARDYCTTGDAGPNITAILQSAVAEISGPIDPRTLKTLRDLVWAIAICGTTRLKELAQALLRRRRARNVKNVETALSKSLKHAPYDEPALFRACRRQVLRQIPLARLRTVSWAAHHGRGPDDP